ncbi:MAG: hypothetical protein KAT05_09640 [Spirochaetes bacterium]|nr:hypothetical protein [Spirochaetota bacterium]
MQNNKTSRITPIIALVTATILHSASSQITNDFTIMPANNYDLPIQEKKYDSLDLNISSLIINNEYEVFLEFTNKLINNTKDIDPKYLEVLDENFWDLLL